MRRSFYLCKEAFLNDGQEREEAGMGIVAMALYKTRKYMWEDNVTQWALWVRSRCTVGVWCHTAAARCGA